MERISSVNADRLWADLHALGAIGRGERGVSRLAFTPADMEGRLWLAERMALAGLSVHIDEAGNVFGALAAGSDGGAIGDTRQRAIVVGSHTDTVPEGGIFDGALGVLGGLEVARALRESGRRLRHPLAIASFSNEEGSRIMPGTFGSRYVTEMISQEEWERVEPFREEAGLTSMERRYYSASSSIPSAPILPGSCLCYLELHIEQGGVLDREGIDIGVVTGIVWVASCVVTFKGMPNHAGTTPMAMRKDALLAAAELVLAIPEHVRLRGGPGTVGTCGQLSVRPGGRNVIPGEAEMSIEVRDLDEAVWSDVMEGIRETAREAAKNRGLALELSSVSTNRGTMMDTRVQDLIERSASSLGLRSRRMPSGAGHDAMNIAAVVPAGMIFVPSKNGISHSPLEWTSKDQCAAGAEVLFRTVIAVDEETP